MSSDNFHFSGFTFNGSIFVKYFENLTTTEESIIEYIKNASIKSSIGVIPSIANVANENAITATAIPFPTFKLINIFSLNVKSLFLKDTITATNLINKNIPNNNNEIDMNSNVNGILIINPISIKTSNSKIVEKISEKYCNCSRCLI